MTATKSMDRNDLTLLTAYREGEKEALNTLFSRYLPLVYNFLLRLTNNKSVAEDAVSETFFKAWKHIDRFDPNLSLKPWLFQIARNTAYDILRKKKLYVFSDFDTEEGENSITDFLHDSAPPVHEVLDQKILSNSLQNALKQLSPEEREILHLYFEEQLTFAEIGDVLQKPLDTVKSKERRAVEKLRRLLPPMHHL